MNYILFNSFLPIPPTLFNYLACVITFPNDDGRPETFTWRVHDAALWTPTVAAVVSDPEIVIRLPMFTPNIIMYIVFA